jgi:hypothetical protein
MCSMAVPGYSDYWDNAQADVLLVTLNALR